MNSFRVRLLIALMISVFLFWAVWLGVQLWQMTRQQTGYWDAMLSNIGTQILLTIPANVEEVSADRPFVLPRDVPFSGEKCSFQIWGRNGRALMRSPDAPVQALMPDFRPGFADTEIDGERWRVFAVSDMTGTVQVQVGKPEHLLREDLNRWVRLSSVSAAVLFAVLLTAVWKAICFTWRPVADVQKAIESRHPNDLRPLPTAALPKEVKPLVESFNGLLQQLDASMRNERRFIADAAHEMRTPMAALLAHAQLAQRADNEEKRNQALAQLIAGVQRNARLSEQMLDMARLDSCCRIEQPQRVRLDEAVQVVARDFEVIAQQKQQHLTVQAEPSVILGDIDLLGILLRNLIDNALRYSGRGGRVAVSCVVERRGEGAAQTRKICLTVADDGPGVPVEERERIFDRFYRAPGARERGSGIGLSLVARIAEVHNASIEIGSGLDGRGVAIAVHFEDVAPTGTPPPERAGKPAPIIPLPVPANRA
jgi:two-component system OmpR family sensor kinase